MHCCASSIWSSVWITVAPVPQYRVFESSVPDGRPSPEDVGFEQQFGPRGVENGLRRDRNSIDFKVCVHNQKNVEVFRGTFRGDKAAPNENAAQFPVCCGEIQEFPKAA
jgi:hypothetical protein